MAEDPVKAALDEVRERNEHRIEAQRFTEYTVANHVAEGDVRRLLAALDKVAALHALTAVVRYTEACPRHYASLLGRAECGDCRKVERTGCQACRDEFGNPARPEDCKERAAVLAALSGKGKAGG